jgi:MarR family transcriptional regulator for hemolysin
MLRFDPQESLGFHCNLTLKAFLGAWEKRLKGTGVSPAQLQALAHLVASVPLSQSELVARLSITPASGVRLVDRMVRDGWVIRQPDPDDGRVNHVVPTKKTVKFWEEYSRTGWGILEQAYQGIKPDEIEMVKRVLGRVRQNLGA